MGRALILETTFLIDFERERARDVFGPATGFLEAHDDARLYITHTIAGELAAGKSLADRKQWEAFIAPFHLLGLNADVDWEYGRAFRHLQDNGAMIGAHDLWIAASALAYGMSVVTRNATHFRRVPGVVVEDYVAAAANERIEEGSRS